MRLNQSICQGQDKYIFEEDYVKLVNKKLDNEHKLNNLIAQTKHDAS
jgi:hypothetical protein